MYVCMYVCIMYVCKNIDVYVCIHSDTKICDTNIEDSSHKYIHTHHTHHTH